MGHKPDQKARKRRRERAEKGAAKKPPITARGLIEAKRQATKEREERLAQRLAATSEAVRKEFRRCEAEIDALHKDHGPRTEAWCETTLYRSLNGPLTRTEIVALQDLLHIQGWDVRYATPLTRKRGPKPVELVLHHHHHSHGLVDEGST